MICSLLPPDTALSSTMKPDEDSSSVPAPMPYIPRGPEPTQLQSPFQPGSTPEHLTHRFMVRNTFCFPEQRLFFFFFCGVGGFVVFSCDQAALWMVFSVRLSVCPSHLFDYVPIIVSSWNFQELSPRTRVTSMQKVRGQRSRSQRSRPNIAVSGL